MTFETDAARAPKIWLSVGGGKAKKYVASSGKMGAVYKGEIQIKHRWFLPKSMMGVGNIVRDKEGRTIWVAAKNLHEGTSIEAKIDALVLELIACVHQNLQEVDVEIRNKVLS